MGYFWLLIMKVSVWETVLVYLMLARLEPPAAAEIVTDVSLVGGSGPHEGNIQVAVSDADGLPMGTGYVIRLSSPFLPPAICNTLGYPGENRFFVLSPYPALYDLSCDDETTLTTVIGCRASGFNFSPYQQAIKCENDTRYLGCFLDTQDARPLATSPCPPGPNSDYSCIDRDNMTTESCLGYCMTLNENDVIITYAGVRAGSECTCGVGATELGNRSDYYYVDCSTPCSGDPTYSNCGGQDHIAAFSITPSSVTRKPEEQEAITTAMPAETDGDTCLCGSADNAVSVPMATPSSVTCEPDKPEATTPAMPAEPGGNSCFCGPADNAVTSEPDKPEATTLAMPAEPDGNSCLCGPPNNAVRNAGIGTGVGAVLLAILAMVNVFVYARTRRQAAKINMVAMTKMKTTAATSTTSNKHEVYQSLTTQPTSDYYTGLDVPSRDQDDGYETPISPGGAHSGASVVALEMGPVYEVMPKTTDSSACSYVNSDYRGRKQEKDEKYVNVRN